MREGYHQRNSRIKLTSAENYCQAVYKEKASQNINFGETMKTFFRTLICISLASMPCFAGAASTAWVPVTEAVTYRTTNQFVVELGGGDTNGCTVSNRYAISASDENYDAIVTTILTAITADRKVQVAFQGGPSGCIGKFAHIDNVSFR